jgi:hypothetical protein
VRLGWNLPHSCCSRASRHADLLNRQLAPEFHKKRNAYEGDSHATDDIVQ